MYTTDKPRQIYLSAAENNTNNRLKCMKHTVVEGMKGQLKPCSERPTQLNSTQLNRMSFSCDPVFIWPRIVVNQARMQRGGYGGCNPP